MALSLCHLLIYVNHALVAIFNVANMSLKAICENKILAKNFPIYIILASPRQNLSSGFPPKLASNQSPQLQRLARIVKFPL